MNTPGEPEDGQSYTEQEWLLLGRLRADGGATGEFALQPSDPGATLVTFGRYKVIGVLGGQRDFGIVYRARDPLQDHDVAVKVPNRELSLELFEGLRTAATQLARLRHPNVCEVTNISSEHGQLYIVMPLLVGSTLSEVIARDPIPTIDALRWARDIALGLHAVHMLGLVHTNVKPGNVCFNDESPVLIGFTMMRRIGQTVESTAGTPPYMAPEQWNVPYVVDPNTDVYALACVLFEALTNRRPFQGDSANLREHHLSSPPLPPSAIRRNLDPSIDALVVRALAKNPADRPTAKEFADEIDGILAGLERKPQPRTSQLALQLSATAPEGTDPKQLQADLLELYKALNDYHLALGGSGLTPVSPRPGAGE
jgi:serine/threonine protein kinase